MDIATLVAVLGHSNLRVIQKHVHATPKHRIKVTHKVPELAEKSAGEMASKVG